MPRSSSITASGCSSTWAGPSTRRARSRPSSRSGCDRYACRGLSRVARRAAMVTSSLAAADHRHPVAAGAAIPGRSARVRLQRLHRTGASPPRAGAAASWTRFTLGVRGRGSPRSRSTRAPTAGRCTSRWAISVTPSPMMFLRRLSGYNPTALRPESTTPTLFRSTTEIREHAVHHHRPLH